MKLHHIPRMLGLCAALSAASLLSVPAAVAGPADKSITIGMGEDFPTLDGYINTSRDGVVITMHIYDMLIYRNPKTFEYEPLLATSWKRIDDKTLEFKLREGVTFHDGSPLTAEDVAFTYNYWAKPENGARSQVTVSWIDHAEVVDDHTVRVIAKAAAPAALEFVAGSLPIYPSDYFQSVGAKAFGQKPIGAGPYKVESNSDGIVKLVAYEGYYKGGAKRTPSITTVNWRIIPDTATRIAEVIGGGVDWVWNVPSDQVEQLKAVPTLDVALASTMRISMVALDAAGRTGDTPLKDVRVRQAINHAIDRKTIVENLVGGDGEIINAPCHPVQFGCDQSAAVVYDYNPEKAKALLAEAGYANGFSTTLGSYRDRARAEAVQSYLAAVGIKAELEMRQASPSFSSWREGKMPLWYGDWGSFSLADSSASMGNMFDGSNNDGARDEKVIELVKAASSVMDPDERKKKYSEAIGLITKQAYWVPMHTIVMGYAYTNTLDFKPTLDELPRFYDASWK
ncbi:ABC transporter substrate-binding protein [Paracandidimonas soli]|uniref:Peptide/nickel transport system substrate-binding protein n=1 Tax=Paracandidimonas soli TaxID=1917182 RepID=A0A4R3UN56_9BURK|nr:ABC transporter substrate-binding protein [Paracandidimonas soli]TCU93125.1 peptide/nickel transport system substrate-binding protein [Paracandidimonas soli]